MKNKRINLYIRLASLLLAALLCMSCFVSCSGKKVEVKDPVLECDEGAIPLSFYEFLLSRMKGTLARNRYEVNDPEFWATKIEGSDMTYESYYNESILESCKNYLAAEVLFEREGLKLSDATLAEIDEEVAFYIDYDGGDDVDKFNALVAKYGVDAESLRAAYILEAKYQYLISALYGNGALIADSVKDEYYRANYYRFKQVLLPNFYYEYERDEFGDMIYFDTETGKPLYDSENGVYVYDENGNRIKDDYGSTIFYDTDGNILYDKENGQPSVVVDENGQGIKHYYSESELAERKQTAEETVNSITKGNFSTFESKITENVLIEGSVEAYPDGYYLSRIESAGYEDYMLAILEALEEMEVGEVRMLETDYGYHVIMKYELDAKKYSSGEYAEWFGSFNGWLIDQLFLDKCKDILPDIVVNEENLAKARSIRQIGVNFDY